MSIQLVMVIKKINDMVLTNTILSSLGKFSSPFAQAEISGLSKSLSPKWPKCMDDQMLRENQKIFHF